MLNDSFSCRSTFFCILRDKNGYTIINGTGNYYTEAQTREQTNLWKGDKIMLTINDLITVISLCATFYSLGYMHGKHNSKTEE